MKPDTLSPVAQNKNRVRVGVLGGTFDPPHIGHLVIAQEALVYVRLSQVIFAPTSHPPHKSAENHTPIQDRLEMVRLAIAKHPRFSLSRVDVDREGPTFTVDTMRILRRQWDDNTDWFFIMGMDSLAGLLSWHEPEQLIRLCTLAVFKRPGFEANLDELARQLPGLRERIVFIPAPSLDVAASELQRRIRNGEPITHLVPEAVVAYICENELYKDRQARAP